MRYNWFGTRLMDYVLLTLKALQCGKSMNQSNLTEELWGTSGRGNTSLTTVLFPYMVGRGYMTVQGKRPKLFTITPRGLQVLADHGPEPTE